jgi:DNA-binding beta-propeller fold protein YncE
VCICDLDEEFLGDFAGAGTGDSDFTLPTAMAFDSQDRLYVTDEHLHRVSMFDTAGGFQGKWGVQGNGDGEINGPSGIAFDSQDQAYVVDQHNHRVQKFSRDGEYLHKWGEFGDGQLNMPWGIALDTEDDVYVADWRNDRIQKFAPDGEFLAKYGEPGEGDGQFNRPSALAVDSDGYMYAGDWGNERVQVLGPDGGFQQMLRGQGSLSKWTTEFFASNQNEWRTREIADLSSPVPPHLDTPHHQSSQIEPYFWGICGIALDAEDRLYVPEARRHRFQVYERV